jgi:hypothetical protein
VKEVRECGSAGVKECGKWGKKGVGIQASGFRKIRVASHKRQGPRRLLCSRNSLTAA